MNYQLLMPNSWNITITALLAAIYYIYSLIATSCEKLLICQGDSYSSYSFFIGECGQVCSQSASIISLIIHILFVPVVYLIISYIVAKKK